MLTPSQVNHVQQSFALLPSDAVKVGTLFYANLFELDPQLEMLFKGDMNEQSRKLVGMLSFIVSSLDDLAAALPSLENLAVRHVSYGVQDEDYASVGASLLKTLEQALGPAYSDEVKRSWESAYHVLSSAMMRASREFVLGRKMCAT